MHPYFLLTSLGLEVTFYFYNPNIHPKKEYIRRLKDVIAISKKYNIPLITGRYEVKKWFDLTKNFEQEPEGGKRCTLCYRERLDKTARTAKKLKFDLFGTTLTISPHKDHNTINAIGKELESEKNITYYSSNFKKKDGFKKTIKLSKSLNIYRQHYCGCIYSKHKISQ
ncbi:MAG: epoxyqueuosine reductase QueH [Actinobacteria bacterium]|nr:epoxyqueuosine reductase QueH [Actinomycetota bacterium]